MELLAVAAFSSALIIAWILTPLVRSVALKSGFIDRPGERKIHTQEIAYGGGIAVLIALSAAFAGVYFIRGWPAPRAGQKELAGIPLIAISCGALAALALGLIDDLYKLSAKTKLLAQLVIAVGTVAAGVRFTAFIGDNFVTQAATVLWIVGITNSFNLLDNMDGLCAGTVAIAAALLALPSLENGQTGIVVALAALSGACTGFLKYNRAPASIFLGDAGSLCSGYLMACFAVLVTYYHQSPGQDVSHLAIGIPPLIFAIPLYDTFSVILIRLKEGRPIMRGDNSHFSHRLVDLGMSRQDAVTTIHLCCLAIGLPATVLGQLNERYGLLIVGQAFLVLIIVALLERAGRKRKLQKNGADTPA